MTHFNTAGNRRRTSIGLSSAALVGLAIVFGGFLDLNEVRFSSPVGRRRREYRSKGETEEEGREAWLRLFEAARVEWLDRIPHGVNFVPFPHNDVGIEREAQCDWVATMDPDGAAANPVVASLLGGIDVEPDLIQASPLKDGICLHRDPSVLARLHLFSTRQANECLTKSDVVLAVAGDSFTQQLFIGLAEVLLGVRSRHEIKGAIVRGAQLKKAEKVRTMAA